MIGPARRLRRSLLSAVATLGLLLGALIAIPGVSQAAGSLPCDIYGNAGTPCVAAHSTVRAVLSSYSGPLYQVTRASDGATADIGLLAQGGYVNAAQQDAFCANTTCRIGKVYDQTARHNDLYPGPAGTAGMGADRGADASEIAVTAGGHKAYGIWISPASATGRTVRRPASPSTARPRAPTWWPAAPTSDPPAASTTATRRAPPPTPATATWTR
ncbi:hypothetical protein GCM10025734_08630 [Kitasatospora paranensis]